MLYVKFDPGPLLERLEQSGARAKDLRPVFQRFVPAVKRDIQTGFQDERDPEGWRWADRKYEQQLKHPKLRLTTRMYKSIRLIPRRDRFSQSATPFYSRFHQYGTKKMPARPFLGFRPHRQREIARAVARYILHGELP